MDDFVSLLLFISLQGKKITVWQDLTKLNVCKTNLAAFKHPTPVTKCVFSKGCKYLATYASDAVLRVFMVSVFGKDLKRFAFFQGGGGSNSGSSEIKTPLKFNIGLWTGGGGNFDLLGSKRKVQHQNDEIIL